MRRVLLLFVVSPLLLCACASTSPTPVQQAAMEETTEKKLPIDSLVTVGQLDNGLRYVIRKNQKPENRVELRLVVDVGSVLEDEEQQGLAHFAELRLVVDVGSSKSTAPPKTLPSRSWWTIWS